MGVVALTGKNAGQESTERRETVGVAREESRSHEAGRRATDNEDAQHRIPALSQQPDNPSLSHCLQEALCM